jgi:hypothetical protein
VTTVDNERLQLGYADRARYFAPVAFCGFIASICAALMVTSLFLPHLPDAIALTAAGGFGFTLASGLGAAFLWVQLRELRYQTVQTPSDAKVNFDRVARLTRSLGWQITSEQPGQLLTARTSDTVLHRGEIVAVRFRRQEVLIASICDPSVGYSLIGRRHCQQHRERIRHAVLQAPLIGPPDGPDANNVPHSSPAAVCPSP